MPSRAAPQLGAPPEPDTPTRMLVAVDANVLIADPWLRSQRTGALFRYVEQTRSRLLLLEAVEQEVAAHMRRALADAAGGVESAVRQATRAGVHGLPAVNAAELGRRSYEAWEAEFRRAPHPGVATRVPLDPTILPEVVRRAAHRVATVRANGRETRDAILWLALVRHLRSRRPPTACVWISANTDDFAAADRRSLRPDLQPDLEGLPARFDYFPSVDAFLQTHAQPITHITVEWVQERLNAAEAHALIADAVRRVGQLGRHLRVVNEAWYGEFEPITAEEITEVAATLDDVHVWDVADDLADVFLNFDVQVSANAQCRATAPDTWPQQRSRGFYGERRFYETLPCHAAYRVSVAAEIQGGALRLSGVEHVATQ